MTRASSPAAPLDRPFPARVRRAPLAALAALALVPLLPLFLWASGLVVPSDGGSPFASARSLLDTAAHDGIALLLVVVVVTALGGWRSVLGERRRVASWWAVAALVGYGVVSLVRFTTPLRDGAVEYLGALLLLVLAVAAVEELVFRGALVVGLRRALPEWAVWLVATVTFGLAHLIGPDHGGAYQLVTTVLVGSACYLARRVTGTLVAPVVLHALYDAFLGFRTVSEPVSPLLNVAATAFLLVAAIGGLVVALRHPAVERHDAAAER